MVSSESWGTASAEYDAIAYDVDLFAWRYQNFLPAFAAGNLGYLAVDTTVTSPAVAKNCLAVGGAAPTGCTPLCSC